MLEEQETCKNLPRKVFIKTYGCQMNVYDTEKMVDLLYGCNYQITSDIKQADLILLNTCSIREKPEHKIYSILGRLKKLKDKNPDLILGVGGCVAQQEGEKLFEKSPHLDLVFGTHSINKLPNLLKEIEEKKAKVCEINMSENGYLDEGVSCYSSQKVSSYVSIIRGCNNFCSFCIVPYVRGRERSRPKEEILEEVKHLSQSGVKEVVLLGQNVNSYGNDLGVTGGFPRLLASINDIKGVERIRFITSHPKDLSDDLIRCFKELDKVCKHIHLPVQSGSNKILKLMNRRYTRDNYLEKVDKLRRVCPAIGITSDMIVGFPQETQRDFEDTLELMKEVKFDDLFSFQYSDRPMTHASRFNDKIPSDVKRERLRILQEDQNEYSLEKNKAVLHKIEEVLVEGVSKKDPHCMTGKTGANKTVNFAGGDNLRGMLVSVKISGVHLHSLKGELV
ncbi:MAG: tRNA (N6-isopentenyl adenosine(37)-C2)-methylthiotransferase MiaB [Deltaproteobacteria bacterium]|nr:tRNA (N6-isopentenyl adenosine(37)-C2)-methylthiotransferase MiaB [Deltaproteobacteria bacterium]MBW2652781.1 tRNA (N6-isopentenyl adenosine(37)-C2)-methylthiotransferase MiaB [Deltaproteobacteria bacterium]